MTTQTTQTFFYNSSPSTVTVKGFVWRQSVGYVKAKKAEELKIGEYLMWHSGIISEIVDIQEASPKFLTVTLKENGSIFYRKMKKDREFAASFETADKQKTAKVKPQTLDEQIEEVFNLYPVECSNQVAEIRFTLGSDGKYHPFSALTCEVPKAVKQDNTSDYPSFEVAGETVERDYKEGDEQPCAYWFNVQGKLIDIRRISGYQSLCADNEDKIYEIYMDKYKTRHDYPTYHEWQYAEWIPYVSQLIEEYLVKPQPKPTAEQEFNAVKNIQQDDLKTRYEQWVMSLIEKGQSAKIISFEDWKAIADFILA
jgi:hydrogenase maturation factor